MTKTKSRKADNASKKTLAVWTEDRVELLSKLWLNGVTAAEITSQLGGTTRNAVIGKAYRLGLSNQKRQKKTSHEEETEEAESAAVETDSAPIAETDDQEIALDALDADDDASEGTVDDATSARLAEALSEKLQLMQLSEKTCKWPIGDPATDDFWFCGLPSMPGKPYCEPHNKLATQPLTSRKDRKNARKSDLLSFAK